MGAGLPTKGADGGSISKLPPTIPGLLGVLLAVDVDSVVVGVRTKVS